MSQKVTLESESEPGLSHNNFATSEVVVVVSAPKDHAVPAGTVVLIGAGGEGYFIGRPNCHVWTSSLKDYRFRRLKDGERVIITGE